MSNPKKKTPLQEAIKWHKAQKYKFPATVQERKTNENIDATIDFLELLLPQEKEFAKEMWDASGAYGCYSDGPCSEYAPDFDELYQQYEP